MEYLSTLHDELHGVEGSQIVDICLFDKSSYCLETRVCMSSRHEQRDSIPFCFFVRMDTVFIVCMETIQITPCLTDDIVRDASEFGDIDTIALIHTTGHDLLEEDDIMIRFIDADMIVSDLWVVISESDKLMIVCRKECLCTDMRDDILDDGSGESDTVIGRCATTKLIEDDEALRCRIVDDVCYFDHLGHKCRLPLRDHIATTDSREDAIDETDLSTSGWHSQTTLCHEDDDSILPEIG